jgi:DNA-binding response OmpR family regulator
VALLDIGMPRLNGYEAARAIRGQAWSDGVRLIALTGWGQLEDRRRAIDAGFDSHMVKPVDLSELDRLLERLLGEPAAIAGSPPQAG